ncbi:MAG TPA: serine hydrolase [Candidatus Rubrimentiphilum sp.]|nr:serine hydrolase [Candidatus Rubrimentiphilum sp.]
MLTADEVTAAAIDAGLAPASIVVESLDRSGPHIHIDADRYFYPASMIKTPLAAAAFALVGDGELRLDDRLDVTEANMTANDKPSPLVPGYVATLQELIELAITISDNVATNMLYDVLDRSRATETVQRRFGLAQTAFYRKLSGSEPLINDPLWDGVHRNTHNAGDAAKLFALVARDEVPYAAVLRDILARQEWNNKLSLGLRAGDRFAHKTGDTDEVTHDGGIVETENGASYVVVVYTGLPSSDGSNARFAPFMRAVRKLL